MRAELAVFLRARADERKPVIAMTWPSAPLLKDMHALPPGEDWHLAGDALLLWHAIDQLLDAHERAGQASDWGAKWESDFFEGLDHAVRIFAHAFRDHPDYQPEWAP